MFGRSTGTIGELLNADYTYSSGTLEAPLAQLYGVNAAQGRISLERRRGILNQGAFLSVFAHAHESSPVLRGVTIGRRLACLPIQSPSELNILVAPPLPDLSKSTRERFAAHSCGRGLRRLSPDHRPARLRIRVVRRHGPVPGTRGGASGPDRRPRRRQPRRARRGDLARRRLRRQRRARGAPLRQPRGARVLRSSRVPWLDRPQRRRCDGREDAVCGDGVVDVGDRAVRRRQPLNGDGNACNVRLHRRDVRRRLHRGPGEACDDGNTEQHRRPAPTCCKAATRAATASSRPGERGCDDGNARATATAAPDACKAASLRRRRASRPASSSATTATPGQRRRLQQRAARTPMCGDGFVQAGAEQCDDGNLVNRRRLHLRLQERGDGPEVPDRHRPVHQLPVVVRGHRHQRVDLGQFQHWHLHAAGDPPAAWLLAGRPVRRHLRQRSRLPPGRDECNSPGAKTFDMSGKSCGADKLCFTVMWTSSATIFKWPSGHVLQTIQKLGRGRPHGGRARACKLDSHASCVDPSAWACQLSPERAAPRLGPAASRTSSFGGSTHRVARDPRRARAEPVPCARCLRTWASSAATSAISGAALALYQMHLQPRQIDHRHRHRPRRRRGCTR